MGIFMEVREGYMKDITIDDVKEILREKVRQTIKHINLYEWETNKWNEKELQERIDEIDKKENKLKERLQNDFKGTTEHLAKEVDRILKKKELKPDKKNYEYRGLISRWVDLSVIREVWKKDILKGVRKTDEEYFKELEDKWKLGLWENPNEVRDLLKSVDDGGTPSVITNNLRKISEKLDVKISKSDKPIDVINNIRSATTNETSPLFSKMYPKHLERMRENKRRERTIVETEVFFNHKGFVE